MEGGIFGYVYVLGVVLADKENLVERCPSVQKQSKKKMHVLLPGNTILLYKVILIIEMRTQVTLKPDLCSCAESAAVWLCAVRCSLTRTSSNCTLQQRGLQRLRLVCLVDSHFHNSPMCWNFWCKSISYSVFISSNSNTICSAALANGNKEHIWKKQQHLTAEHHRHADTQV